LEMNRSWEKRLTALVHEHCDALSGFEKMRRGR
jgi:hypothetical protein